MTAAIRFEDFVLEFGHGASAVRALDGVTLAVPDGCLLGIVGESGSGKSTAAFAAGRLMPQGVGPKSGRLTVLGRDVWNLPIADLRQMRIHDLRYIFQDPIATLDPTKKIGWQIREAAVGGASPEDVKAALRDVGMNDPDRVAASWPHELSGGMAQRAVIAMALIARPRIIIADEATSALDASVRTRILELLRDASRDRGITLILVSHDLWAVRKFCDRIAVMYGGRVVEDGPADRVFGQPAHPYTRALLAATVGQEARGDRLATIPGIPPLLHGACPGCAFAPRCDHAQLGLCDTQRPQTEDVEEGWHLLCHRWQDIRRKGISHGAD
jgi:peptide/nickel transport system ATP-binding protein